MQAAASASRNVSLPFPSFSVQTLTTTQGGHPDVIGALSSALLAHIQVSPEVIQSLGTPFGPLPLPFPQPQPLSQPAVELAPFAEVDLSALVPAEQPEIVVDASADPSPDQAPADVAEGQTGPVFTAAQVDTRPAITVAAAEPAVLVESAPAADDAAAAEVPAAETLASAPASVSTLPAVVASAPAAQTQASVKTAAPPTTTVAAAKPEPKPTPLPQVVRKVVVPVEDEPVAKPEPTIDRDITVQLQRAAPRPAPTNTKNGGKPGPAKAQGGNSKRSD
jgi:hypothetical protein